MSNRKKISTTITHITERRKTGDIGEQVATQYLLKHGFEIVGRNIARKTGELDVVARKGRVLHFIEVKTLRCIEFPLQNSSDSYTPGENLHASKLAKVVRTAEWYVANVDWGGEWQVDGMLVWLRERDGRCLVRYLPQLL